MAMYVYPRKSIAKCFRRFAQSCAHDTETMLMLSDSSFTTQTSSFLRGVTDTGSIPTGICLINSGGF